MMKNVNGVSFDILVHPGETLKEVLEDRHISKEELAIKTEYSTRYIREVVNGKRDISFEFANRLEHALSISTHFWMNLQENYSKLL